MKAFPFEANVLNFESCQGMDLRDYFAAKAMQSLIKQRYPHEIFEQENAKDIYKAAYFVADEMMKVREQ